MKKKEWTMKLYLSKAKKIELNLKFEIKCLNIFQYKYRNKDLRYSMDCYCNPKRLKVKVKN